LFILHLSKKIQQKPPHINNQITIKQTITNTNASDSCLQLNKHTRQHEEEAAAEEEELDKADGGEDEGVEVVLSSSLKDQN
jgi:hypothetical protein